MNEEESPEDKRRKSEEIYISAEAAERLEEARLRRNQRRVYHEFGRLANDLSRILRSLTPSEDNRYKDRYKDRYQNPREN